ncbi:MAG: MFS transporter [Marivivens sp.]|nr:MFS transporter [Marivivens sp.]
MKLTSDSRAKRNVLILVLAQATLGAQLPMIFVIGGWAGGMLATNACLATLPISMIVFGSMTTAPWLSPLMQRSGRRFGFMLGALAGALGAIVSALGLYSGSFMLLLAGSYITGIYMSAQGFYRFAAADTASEEFRPRAISYVLAGGLVSAIVGPQLNKIVQEAFVVPFLGSYIAIVAINLVGLFLFIGLDLPAPNRKGAKNSSPEIGRSSRQILSDPKILVAIIVAMVSYALMNLVMTATPLAVLGCGYSTSNANDIVTAHVLAMFVPSFFTGHLVNRFGTHRIMALGLTILGGAGAVALSGIELENFFVALVLLGIGWNFGFIGATTLLASAHTEAERGRVQGLNDMIVFGCVTVASLASGGLMNCSGNSAETGWTAVNLAMLPLLTLAGAALIWLIARPNTARA